MPSAGDTKDKRKHKTHDTICTESSHISRPDRKAGLDSGLDSGLDFGLDSGLDFGLTFIDLK